MQVLRRFALVARLTAGGLAQPVAAQRGQLVDRAGSQAAGGHRGRVNRYDSQQAVCVAELLQAAVGRGDAGLRPEMAGQL